MGDAVQQMFTAIARRYDVLNTVLSFGLHHYWRQQAVTVSGIPSDARLLDVCSGTADLALAFARHLGHDGQVIAMDFCAAMLGRGRAALGDPGDPRARHPVVALGAGETVYRARDGAWTPPTRPRCSVAPRS